MTGATRWELYVARELARARALHPGAQASAHEGLAVLWEEFEELKAEVFKKQNERSADKMRKEAVQIAAMAVRFIEDVIDKDNRR